jgi:hypothetical protein
MNTFSCSQSILADMLSKRLCNYKYASLLISVTFCKQYTRIQFPSPACSPLASTPEECALKWGYHCDYIDQLSFSNCFRLRLIQHIQYARKWCRLVIAPRPSCLGTHCRHIIHAFSMRWAHCKSHVSVFAVRSDLACPSFFVSQIR